MSQWNICYYTLISMIKLSQIHANNILDYSDELKVIYSAAESYIQLNAYLLQRSKSALFPCRKKGMQLYKAKYSEYRTLITYFYYKLFLVHRINPLALAHVSANN